MKYLYSLSLSLFIATLIPAIANAKGSGFTGGIDIVTTSHVWEGDPRGTLDYGVQFNGGYKYNENFYLMGDFQYIINGQVLQVTGNVKSPWWGESLPVSPFVIIGTGFKVNLHEETKEYLFYIEKIDLEMQPILNFGFGFDIFIGSGLLKLQAYQVIPTSEIQCLLGFDWTF